MKTRYYIAQIEHNMCGVETTQTLIFQFKGYNFERAFRDYVKSFWGCKSLRDQDGWYHTVLEADELYWKEGRLKSLRRCFQLARCELRL